MRRKRLQHVAQNLGQMFCGWQLFQDWSRLSSLGAGIIEMDFRTGLCTHNGVTIPPLTMMEVLGHWLNDDLKSQGLSLESLETATLKVEFSTERHTGQRVENVRWGRPTRDYVGCKLSCIGSVSTDECVYTATYEDYEEWPAKSRSRSDA